MIRSKLNGIPRSLSFRSTKSGISSSSSSSTTTTSTSTPHIPTPTEVAQITELKTEFKMEQNGLIHDDANSNSTTFLSQSFCSMSSSSSSTLTTLEMEMSLNHLSSSYFPVPDSVQEELREDEDDSSKLSVKEHDPIKAQQSRSARSHRYSRKKREIISEVAQFCIEGPNHSCEDRAVYFTDLVAERELASLAEIEKVVYLAVFDGHGGENCSEFLSQTLHHKIIENSDFDEFEKAGVIMEQAFRDTEKRFIEICSQTRDTSGACATVALIKGRKLFIANTGDCRAVLWTGSKNVTQLTTDHRGIVPDELKRIESAGGFVRYGRVQGVLSPSRSFGDIDVKEKQKGVVISDPEIVSREIEICKSARFSFLILATDGLWDCVSNEKATKLVYKILKKKNGTVDEAAKNLSQYAAKYSVDDVTVVIHCWRERVQQN